MKKLMALGVSLALIVGIYLSYTTVDTTAPAAVAAGKTYSGTFYIAGMGGHFAKAEVEIDPSNEAAPIKIKNLDRTVIGSKDTHPTHDARIDSNDNTKMFWSTYKFDKSITDASKAHVGITDLKTGNVIMDKAVSIDPRALWTGALYCASAQSKNVYIPITMTAEAFLDLYDKKSMELKRRVFLDELGYKNNYFFYHGINTPDMKTLALTINLTETWTDMKTPANRIGKVDMLLLDMAALEEGKVKVLAKNQVTGDPKKTFTFRQTFSADGKNLFQSGADRMYHFDGQTLKLLNEVMMTDGENHDALSTPDGKYVVMTLRTAAGEEKDGAIQLYDVQNKKIVGKAVSVCLDCHKQMGLPTTAVLCGGDVNWH